MLMGVFIGVENGLLEDSVYFDVDYRRVLGFIKVVLDFEVLLVYYDEIFNV